MTAAIGAQSILKRLSNRFTRTTPTAKAGPTWRHWLSVAIAIGLGFTILFITCWMRLDPDFGWHLQAGNYIRSHGIPAHDVFTYTASDFRWIDHEWGSDVLISLLYQWGGFIVLSLVFAGIWTGALLISGLKSHPVVMLIAVAAMLPYVMVRPYAWTVLLLSILLTLLVRNSPWLWRSAPLLFMVWANLHAGFMVGFAALAFFAIKERRLSWGLLLVVCVLATFINPYGPGLYIEVFRTLSDTSLHTTIAEWRRFYIFTESIEFVLLWVAGFLWFNRTKLRHWVDISLLLFAGALLSTRYMPLFIIAGSSDLASFFERVKISLPKLFYRVFVACALTWLVAIYYGVYAFASWQRELLYPSLAVTYLQQHPCSGNLFNEYNFGGYLIWKLSGQPVYIDGRMPSWRNAAGQKYLDIYHQTIDSAAFRSQQFSRYRIRCAVLGRSAKENRMVADLRKSGWRRVVQANNYVLVVAP